MTIYLFTNLASSTMSESTFPIVPSCHVMSGVKEEKLQVIKF